MLIHVTVINFVRLENAPRVILGMYVNHEFMIAVITVIFALYRDFCRLP